VDELDVLDALVRGFCDAGCEVTNVVAEASFDGLDMV